MNRVWKICFAAASILTATAATALAEKESWTCKYTATGGLAWDNGRWVQTTIISAEIVEKPFRLVVENGVVTEESAEEAWHRDWVCSSEKYTFTSPTTISFCNGPGGGAVFNTKKGEGAISRFFAGAAGGFYKTMTVRHFTCQ